MNEDLRLHREAELMMARADFARVQSRPRDAARFSHQAAELEAQVFDLLPLDRPKTRGITAISSVALYRKAGELDEAIRQARVFLALHNLPEFARLDLEEMIEEMRAELFVSTAFHSLTPQQQHILALRLAGVTIEEIAARLDISSQAVLDTVSLARRQAQAIDASREKWSQDDSTQNYHEKLAALTA